MNPLNKEILFEVLTMRQRISTLKKIDRLIGPLLADILPKKKEIRKNKHTINKILVIRPGGMGDAALLLPILKKVKLSLPDLTVDILCEHRNSGIFKSIHYTDNILHYDNPVHLFKLIQQKYDIIIDTEQSYYLSAVLCSFLKSHIKIGFDTGRRGRLFNKSVQYSQNKYEAKVFWDLFCEVLPVKNDIQWNFPYFKHSKTAFKHSKDFTDKTGKIVCLFPGASKKECMWPEECWADVIDAIYSSGKIPVILGGVLETNTVNKIIGYCKAKKTINYTGMLSLLETSWLFKISALLITTDSGILHLGVMSDIATISLFGAGNAAKWGPTGRKHKIINKNIFCSPCAMFGTIPPCGNDTLCMKKITSNEVINECMNILKG